MSDLFSPFRDAEQLPTPPVEDVRRRGDVLRRRRQALQVGGIAALVAAVVLGGVGLSGGLADRSAEPPVATGSTSPEQSSPEPSVTTPPSETSAPAGRVTTIPADLELAPQWQDRDGAGEEEVLRGGRKVQWLSDVVECDSSHSPADESTDHLAVVYSMPEHTQARDLRAFADDVTAERVATDYVGWFRDCPRFSIDDGASETRNAVKPVALGDRAWQVTQTYWMGDGQPTLGENILIVVQIGNSVLVSQSYGEGPGAIDPEASQRNAEEQARALEPLLVEISCTFGNAGGC